MVIDRNVIESLAGSAVVAALVAGLVALRTNARNIKVANVISERAKWRDKIRDLALQTHRAMFEYKDKELSELHSQLTLNLNPGDPEDRSILKLVGGLPEQKCVSTILDEFTNRLALLLKHDWERAKWESTSIWGRIASRQLRCPKRITFSEFTKTEGKSPPEAAGHEPLKSK